MIVTAKTRISAIIDTNSKAIDVIASINANFRKLKNPILRKLLASQVNVEQAARIGKTSCEIILKKLEEIGFEVVLPAEAGEMKVNPAEEKTDTGTMNIHSLDVRAMLAEGNDPFSLIMKTIKDLPVNTALEIVNTFEPIPLINILARNGYKSWTNIINDKEYRTYFLYTGKVDSTVSEEEKSLPDFQQLLRQFAGKFVQVDVRQLEMPYPMITILNELAELKPGLALLVHHKRVPQLLLPELDSQDFRYAMEEPEEGYVKMIIYR
jgi:uncharacterized protein (DUF2249 family)